METMLNFVLAHRREIIALSRKSIDARSVPVQQSNEVPVFLNLFLSQLTAILAHTFEETSLKRSAAIHGGAMHGLGYSVSHVVHDYGDIGQAITSLIVDNEALVSTEDFFVLHHCIDEAIGEAVTEFERVRDRAVAKEETVRSGIFAHELRNKIAAANLGFQSIVSGRAPIGGSVAAIVTRGFHNLEALIERSLLEVRVDSGFVSPERVHLYQFMEEAGLEGKVTAEARGVQLSIQPPLRGIDVEVDPRVLGGAVTNLLQNAFKFTPQGGKVLLRSTVLDQRVLIDVADECGGLPPGKPEELFKAFEQRGSNRSGLGLGLFISRKGVEAIGGLLHVSDLPGVGCVFTIDLPQAAA